MRALQAEGVKTIFGYPGGAIMPVYDSLYDYTRGEKKCFDHILVRHEQAATHAAEGFARVSGEVGVALVTSGPGATNTLTGLADAMMDSTPIVVIAGQVAISTLGTDAFQEVDLVGVAQPISKWAYQIRHAEDIAWAVSRAFYIARSGRPGPAGRGRDRDGGHYVLPDLRPPQQHHTAGRDELLCRERHRGQRHDKNEPDCHQAGARGLYRPLLLP